tara:strand:- start:5809 stop:7407 length:1599 start_codon:yes stop_codon:yes gene_type:complete
MGKNILIVLGFLLLCILLSLKKEEGFVTINVSEFETACNADDNTCIVGHTGALGSACLPSPHQNLYNLSPIDEAERDPHKETFNIRATGCSPRAYHVQGQVISAQVCENEGQAYTLSGCAAKCSRRADSETGYSFTTSLPLYVSPEDQGIIDIQGSCDDGYMEARNTCFNRDGTINGETTPERCANAGGIWYDDTGNNSIKLVCEDPEVNPNYIVIGCEPACLSRDSELNEYMATPEDLSNPDKEIIQILHRTDPSTSEATEVITPQSQQTPYQMDESSLNPGAFSVTGTHQSTNFSSEGGEPIPIDFAGVVESSQGCNLLSPNTYLQRKYPVSGLFPVCDSQTHECLNFNITYNDVPTGKMNIEDFKNTMNENASEIGIPDGELENYKNSLYYYRRYKDRDDKTHIEGQIRCNNDPDSPFHCIITDPDPFTWILGDAEQNCNEVCSGYGYGATCIVPDISSNRQMQEIMGDALGGVTCSRVIRTEHEGGFFGYRDNGDCKYPRAPAAELNEESICRHRASNSYRPLCKCQR